jgi:hypothetical protein|tara:strand:+ start:166 stop:888 length:723 start_codon:yes stop_codon:yes gene_type:complete
MKKRGQLTIFILVAIVIIAIVLAYFLFFKKNLSEYSNPDVEKTHVIIKDCIESNLVDSIRLIGLQGGYFTLPERYFETELSRIAYGYYNRENTLISISKMEDEIDSYIEVALPLCVDENNLDDLNIEKKEVNAKVNIKKNSVSAKIDFPVCITKEESTSCLKKDYSSEIEVRLGDIHNIAANIINQKIKYPDLIDLTYLSSFSYSVSILPYDSNIFIYLITDENYELNEVPYVFRFAMRK